MALKPGLSSNSLCKKLSTSMNELRGRAVNLLTSEDVIYTRLPPNSIDSFKTLVENFEAQYTTSQSHHLISIALEEDESLHAFMEHFLAIAIKIKGFSLEVPLH
ncbi:hypothetical protein CR513_13659, partial [Mucuna pruriens]